MDLDGRRLRAPPTHEFLHPIAAHVHARYDSQIALHDGRHTLRRECIPHHGQRGETATDDLCSLSEQPCIIPLCQEVGGVCWIRQHHKDTGSTFFRGADKGTVVFDALSECM